MNKPVAAYGWIPTVSGRHSFESFARNSFQSDESLAYPINPRAEIFSLLSSGTRFFVGVSKLNLEPKEQWKDSPLAEAIKELASETNNVGQPALLFVAEQRSMHEIKLSPNDFARQSLSIIRTTPYSWMPDPRRSLSWQLKSLPPNNWRQNVLQWLNSNQASSDAVLFGTIHLIRYDIPTLRKLGVLKNSMRMERLHRELKEIEEAEEPDEFQKHRMQARSECVGNCNNIRRQLQPIETCAAQFIITRSGEIRLDGDGRLHNYSLNRKFLEACYNLLMMRLHRHRHHSVNEPICVLQHGELLGRFRERTLFDLYRFVTKQKNTGAISPLRNALGVLAYATSFRKHAESVEEKIVGDNHLDTGEQEMKVEFADLQDIALEKSITEMIHQYVEKFEKKIRSIRYVEILMALVWSTLFPLALWGFNLRTHAESRSTSACGLLRDYCQISNGITPAQSFLINATEILTSNADFIVLAAISSVVAAQRIRTLARQSSYKSPSPEKRKRMPRITASKQFIGQNVSRFTAPYPLILFISVGVALSIPRNWVIQMSFLNFELSVGLLAGYFFAMAPSLLVIFSVEMWAVLGWLSGLQRSHL